MQRCYWKSGMEIHIEYMHLTERKYEITNKIWGYNIIWEFFASLNKYGNLGAATKWNAMETPDTLCMLDSKLPNGVADR